MSAGASGRTDPPLRQARERSVYRNAHVEVFDDDVLLEDGTAGRYVRIVSGQGWPGVAVLAVADGSVALVKTYRYPVATWEWAVPRGWGHGPDPVLSAAAELGEELGAQPDVLVPLGIITPDSGLLASEVHVFLGRYRSPVSAPSDVIEVHGVRWIPLPDLVRQIAVGQVRDAFTLSAVALALAQGQLALE